MKMSLKNALIVFVKNPESGKVKTRLALGSSNKQALEIYLQLLNHTLNESKQLSNCEKYVFYSDKIESNDEWAKNGFIQVLQKGNDLGERMKNAFQHLFSKGHQNCIIIGSDCPQINTEILDIAFNKMKDHDAVIGPANDGGYYLLGIKNLFEQVFENKAWSSTSVFLETMKDFKDLSLNTYILPELIDIDTIEDYIAFQRISEVSNIKLT